MKRGIGCKGKKTNGTNEACKGLKPIARGLFQMIEIFI